tara:strand:- start:47 stop:259 length:213 start_codon:yes stop_codon:yes gene_type:complete
MAMKIEDTAKAYIEKVLKTTSFSTEEMEGMSKEGIIEHCVEMQKSLTESLTLMEHMVAWVETIKRITGMG